MVTLKVFKENVIRFQNKFGDEFFGTDKFNKIWGFTKDLSDRQFIRLVDELVSMNNETPELVDIEDKANEIRNEIEIPSYTDVPDMQQKKSGYCCEKGVVFTFDSEGNSFVFRCDCQWGRNYGWPIWNNQQGFRRRDINKEKRKSLGGEALVKKHEGD